MAQLQVILYGSRIQKTEGARQLRSEMEGAQWLEAGTYGTQEKIKFQSKTEKFLSKTEEARRLYAGIEGARRLKAGSEGAQRF